MSTPQTVKTTKAKPIPASQTVTSTPAGVVTPYVVGGSYHIPWDKIREVPGFNSRPIDHVHVNALADSLGSVGQLQDMLVYPPNIDGWFDAIAGHHRLGAFRVCSLRGVIIPGAKSEIYGTNAVRCTIVDRPKDAEDVKSFKENIIENRLRKDMTPVEIGEACVRLLNLNQSTIAVGRTMNLAQSQVSQYKRLADLSSPMKTLVNLGAIPASMVWISKLDAVAEDHQKLLAVQIAELCNIDLLKGAYKDDKLDKNYESAGEKARKNVTAVKVKELLEAIAGPPPAKPAEQQPASPAEIKSEGGVTSETPGTTATTDDEGKANNPVPQTQLGENRTNPEEGESEGEGEDTESEPTDKMPASDWAMWCKGTFDAIIKAKVANTNAVLATMQAVCDMSSRSDGRKIADKVRKQLVELAKSVDKVAKGASN